MTGQKKEQIRTEEELSAVDRQVIDTVCKNCNFYHEGQEYYEEEYECIAYELVRHMLKDKKIAVNQIEDLFKRIDLNPERELKSGY